FSLILYLPQRDHDPFPTRRSSDLDVLFHDWDPQRGERLESNRYVQLADVLRDRQPAEDVRATVYLRLDELVGSAESLERVADRRSEEHTSELQSRENLVCRLLLEK